MIENRLDTAILKDEFNASLVSNAGCARDVIDGIAAQSHDIDDLFRWDAKCFRDLSGIEDEVIFLRVEHLHLRSNELHHVLVAGDDEDFMLLLGGFASEGTDNIISLETHGLDDGDTKGFKRAANVGHLAAKILGHGLALGFVPLVTDFVKALGFAVPLA